MRHLFGFRLVNDAIMGFRGETRGQSEVVGAILIFGIIVAFIGMNQAFLVPQANSDVEFKHSNDVQRDMVDLRSGLIEAASSNEPRSRSVALGTQYPSRFIALNPPAPTGTLETVEGGEISLQGNFSRDASLSGVCGTDNDQVDTKFIQYRSDYNEYKNDLPITIENNLVYRSNGDNALFSTQRSYVQGNQINIIRYVGDYQATSSETKSVDLIPYNRTGNAIVGPTDDGENVTLTLPTRLNEAQFERTLQDHSLRDGAPNDGEVEIDLGQSRYTVRCTTVGINEAPDVSPKRYASGNQTFNESNFFNPTDRLYLNRSTIEGDTTVDLHFENRQGNSVDITHARVVFYSIAGGEREDSAERPLPDRAEIHESDTELTVGGSMKELNEPVYIDTSPTSVGIDFNFDTEGTGEGNSPEIHEGDWFVLFLEFEGEDETFRGQYFVAPMSEE